MIEYRTEGDLVYDPSDYLICPVNMIPGVMGKGLALAFKRRWPILREGHRMSIINGDMRLGKPSVFTLEADVRPSGNTTQIILFPTKDHWSKPSRLEWIAEGLRSIVWNIRDAALRFCPECHERHDAIESIALSGLGCGLGGLPWHQVRPLIELAELQTPEVNWTVYEPSARNRS